MAARRPANDPSEDPTTDTAGDQAATDTPAGDSGGIVKLACLFPNDVFDPSIEGVDPLTTDGTEVPAGHEQTIRNLARDNGVAVRKVH